MWITLLLMAAAVSFEPFRIGTTVLMLNRPRPLLQLVAFLCGGFAMGVTVGLVALFVVRSAVSPEQFTLPRVQLVIGVFAVVAAAAIAFWPAPIRTEDSRFAARARRLADGRSPWVAAAAGLGIALPSLDYLAALAVIASSGASAGTQIAALLTFNAVAFSFVEIPLLGYLMRPARTRVAMTSLHHRLRSLRRRDVARVLAAVGCVLILVGILGS